MDTNNNELHNVDETNVNKVEFEPYFPPHLPISLEGHWQPWYDDRRDYNTNAPTYYDYLAIHNQLTKTIVKQVNTNTNNIETNSEDISDLSNKLDIESAINVRQDADIEQLKIDVSRQIDLEPAITAANLSTSMDMYRIGRRALYHGSNTVDNVSDEPTFPQSIAYTNNGNIISATYDLSKQTDNVKLVEYNLSNFQILREKTLNLKHANGMCFDVEHNQVLVAPLVDKDNHYHTVIIRLDYNTLNIIDEVFIPNVDEVLGVAYDRYTSKLYTWSIKGDDYIVHEIIDTDATVVFTFPKSDNETPQTLAVHRDLFAFAFTKPNHVDFYDKFKGFITTRSINITSDNHVVGELEGITFDENGVLLIQTVSEYVFANYRFENIWSIDSHYNGGNVKPVYHNIGSSICYVDTDSTSFNPDGTSTRPYKYIEEALNDFTLTNIFKNVSIAEGTYNENIWITNNFVIEANNATVNGITVSYGNGTIKSINVTNTTTRPYALHLFNSSLVIDKLNIATTEKTSEPILCDYSKLKFSSEVTLPENSQSGYLIINKSPYRVEYSNNLTDDLLIKNTYKSSNGTSTSVFLNSIKDVGEVVTLPKGIANDLNNKIVPDFTIEYYVNDLDLNNYYSQSFTTFTEPDDVFITGKRYTLYANYLKNNEFKVTSCVIEIKNGDIKIISVNGEDRIALQRYVVH